MPPLFDFNPRSPCGERLQKQQYLCLPNEFQSTLPVWGATPMARLCLKYGAFQSTLPVWGATAWHDAGRGGHPDFNPRSPCGERPTAPAEGRADFLFQSTLPVWGATCRSKRAAISASISIHAPRVGSDAVHRCIRCQHDISIHAPRVGSDSSSVNVIPPFLLISIHAPRVGSDRSDVLGVVLEDISIHAPRVGSDRSHGNLAGIMSAFQSTLPVWGATAKAART